MNVEELLARESIRHTIASYTVAGDTRDVGMFVELFAENAIFEFAGFPPLEGFRFEGRAAIDPTARWQRYDERERADWGSSFLRHNLTTCLIEVDGPDSARARTYFVVFTDIGPDHCGVYLDDFVRQGDRWLFAHRRIRLDWRSPDSLFPLIARRGAQAKG